MSSQGVTCQQINNIALVKWPEDEMSAATTVILSDLAEYLPRRVKAIIFAGGPSNFCLGLDEKAMAIGGLKSCAAELCKVQSILALLRRVPVVAALDKSAIGYGLLIALACRVRIATPAAFLSKGDLSEATCRPAIREFAAKYNVFSNAENQEGLKRRWLHSVVPQESLVEAALVAANRMEEVPLESPGLDLFLGADDLHQEDETYFEQILARSARCS